MVPLLMESVLDLFQIAKNLGIIIDNELAFESQIQKLVSSCLNIIRKISRIKNFLKIEHPENTSECSYTL